MTYLIIIFLSPVYFLIRQKWGAFVLNSILYLLAGVTIFLAIGVFFWMLAVGHAGWHLRTELMEEQAGIMAKKLAEEMRRPTESGEATG